MTAEIIRLPTAAICGLRPGDPVCVGGDGPFRLLGLVNPSSGEPIAKLWRQGDCGSTFVRLSRVTLWE